MARTHPQAVIMWSGAFLIVVGVLLIVTQLSFEIWTHQFVGGAGPSGGVFTPTHGIDVKTSYVGVMVLGDWGNSRDYWIHSWPTMAA